MNGSMYHPVGTQLKIKDNHFTVSSVDHKAQTYKLKQKNGGETSHPFKQIHSVIKPTPMSKPPSVSKMEKIEFINEMLKLIQEKKDQ